MGFVQAALGQGLFAWPTMPLVLLLLLVLLAPVVHLLAKRPRLPENMPKLLKGWPILGSIEFYKERYNFLQRLKCKGPNKQFSLFYGRYPIVAMTGEVGRSVVFNARFLDLKSAFATLYAANPNIQSLQNDPLASQVPIFKKLLTRDRFVRNLAPIVKDADAAMRFDTTAPVDVFAVMYRLVYQLTHRTFGCKDVADNEGLLQRTLRHYSCMDNCSPWQVMFPELPTPAKLIKSWRGMQLFLELRAVIHSRRKSGTKADDTMEILMESGKSDVEICSFIIELLLAAMINTVANAGWVLCYLAQDKYWHDQVRDEVDALLAKHRKDSSETAVDILPRIALEEWETALPVLDLCLRETIRLKVNGTCVRKNLGTRDVPIPGTSEVVPPQTYCCYNIAEVHLDEEIYKDAQNWDPSRFLPGREEGSEIPMGFLGWGAGLHPCLGMKFAKLEIFVAVATLMSYYDYELVDKSGKTRTDPLPKANLNDLGFKLPKNVLIGCKTRFQIPGKQNFRSFV